MKKITLLGDSIRQIGYGKKVEEAFKGECEVFQPEENCRFAKYTLRMLFDYAPQIAGSDVIHWNNGLWDVSNLYGDGYFSTPEEYRENMLRIAKQLLKITPHVIFATTTPVRENYPYQSNETIDLFNATIVSELKKLGIAINDLNALLRPDVNAYIREDDMLHLSDRGIEVCAAQVISEIRKHL